MTEKSVTEVVADAQYGLANAKREGPLTGLELNAVATELAMLGFYAGTAAVDHLPLTATEAMFVRAQVIRKTRNAVRA